MPLVERGRLNASITRRVDMASVAEAVSASVELQAVSSAITRPDSHR